MLEVVKGVFVNIAKKSIEGQELGLKNALTAALIDKLTLPMRGYEFSYQIAERRIEERYLKHKPENDQWLHYLGLEIDNRPARFTDDGRRLSFAEHKVLYSPGGGVEVQAEKSINDISVALERLALPKIMLADGGIATITELNGDKDVPPQVIDVWDKLGRLVKTIFVGDRGGASGVASSLGLPNMCRGALENRYSYDSAGNCTGFDQVGRWFAEYGTNIGEVNKLDEPVEKLYRKVK